MRSPALLAGATGIAQDVWSRALANDAFEVLRMSDDLTRSQQKVADRFRALGLVPVDIKVSDIVWRANASEGRDGWARCTISETGWMPDCRQRQ